MACDDLVNLVGEEAMGYEEGTLEAHFIDIGQGDSSLIKLPNGELALIDGGPRSGRDKLESYLRAAGVDTIDYMIATHPHEDHIGGLPMVLREFNVKSVYMPDRTANTKIFEELLREIDNEGLKIKIAKAGDSLIDDKNLKFYFVAPNSKNYDSTNDYSVVSKIEYGNNSILITGDAEKTSEKEMVKSAYNLKSDVLRVAHHGSRTSSTIDFLREVDPKYFVISLGKDNDYNHPHKETINKLVDFGGRIYRTDELGDIVFISDGSKIEFKEAKEDLGEGGEEYIANKNTNMFHSKDCSYLPKKENQLIFKSKDEALRSGYKPHDKCVK